MIIGNNTYDMGIINYQSVSMFVSSENVLFHLQCYLSAINTFLKKLIFLFHKFSHLNNLPSAQTKRNILRILSPRFKLFCSSSLD